MSTIRNCEDVAEVMIRNGLDPGQSNKSTQSELRLMEEEIGSSLEFEDEAAHLLKARVRSGAWLQEQVFPPLRWAVEGVVPEGFGLIVAPPKAGKSWFVLGVALAKAQGEPALGSIPTGKSPVLYLALEDGYPRLQARCRTLLGGDKIRIPATLDFIINAQPQEVLLLVEQWLDRHREQTPLVILDTLGKVLPPRRSGENDYQRDYRLVGKLKAIADAVPGSTVLAVHHTRKAFGDDFVDTVSGTNGIAGAADFVLVLARKRHSNAASLAVTGRDVAEGEYAITSHAGAWVLDGVSLGAAAAALTERKQTEKLGDRSAEVVALVNSREQVCAADVADCLGIDSNMAGTYLRRLAEAGHIRRIRRGTYCVLDRPYEVSEVFEGPATDSPLADNSAHPPSRLGSDCG